MIANLLTWLALAAQTVSACGSGLALSINRHGDIRLEVAGTPCDVCAHEACVHVEDNEYDCCTEEEAYPLAAPTTALTSTCDCLHLELADPALAVVVGQTCKLSDETPADIVMPLTALTASDLSIAACLHDPPVPHPFTSQLLMLRSVMLRC